MRSTPSILGKLVVAAVMVVITSGKSAAPSAAVSAATPAFASIGPLTFSADGTLFAADTQQATIYAVDLGAAATGGAPPLPPGSACACDRWTRPARLPNCKIRPVS